MIITLIQRDSLILFLPHNQKEIINFLTIYSRLVSPYEFDGVSRGKKKNSTEMENHPPPPKPQPIPKNGKDYDTSYSRVVSDHSTDEACSSLTSRIGRDGVFSTEYGRNQEPPIWGQPHAILSKPIYNFK